MTVTAAPQTSRSHHLIPRLALWSLILTALPLVIHFSYFGLGAFGGSTRDPIYVLLLEAWNAIPYIWLVSIALGVVTLTLKRSRRWRLAGIPAIVLPIGEFAFVAWWLADLLTNHPI